MARTVAGPKPGSTRTFVPKAFENHLDDSPVTVQLTTPTEAEKRELQRERGMTFVFDEEGKAEGVEPADKESWKLRAVTKCADCVTNYTGADGQIVTGKDMVDHGEIEFIDEIASEIMSAASLSSGELKNSEGSSGSSDPVTLVATSIAATA